MSIIVADPPQFERQPDPPTSRTPAPTTSMLASPDAPVGYAFTPLVGSPNDPDVPDEVTVVRTDKRRREVYVLSVEDARTLWRFLRAKGFEVF